MGIGIVDRAVEQRRPKASSRPVIFPAPLPSVVTHSVQTCSYGERFYVYWLVCRLCAFLIFSEPWAAAFDDYDDSRWI